MFIENYTTPFYMNLICDNYEMDYLNGIDQENFDNVYQIFKKYNFNYIDDILLNYLEIFSKDAEMVEKELLSLKEQLGEDFVSIISKRMVLLEYILLEMSEGSNS